MTSILKELTPVGETQEKPKTVTKEPKTIEDWQTLKAQYVQQLDAFRKTEKKIMTPNEAKEFRKSMWAIRFKIAECRDAIIELKAEKHRKEKKASVSNVALKQGRFMTLLRQGFSITNITLNSEGVDKASLPNIMTDDFIKDCGRVRFGFGEMWQRWKEKYLK